MAASVPGLLSRGCNGLSRALPLAVVIAVAAGCGGGDDATSTTASEPRPLTKAEFLHEADRICFATEAQIEAAVDDLVTGRAEPPPGEVRRAVRDLVAPRLRAQVDTIRLLGIPPGDEAEVERILRATERGASQLESDPLTALEGPPPALREAERLARRYGSERCGLTY